MSTTGNIRTAHVCVKERKQEMSASGCRTASIAPRIFPAQLDSAVVKAGQLGQLSLCPSGGLHITYCGYVIWASKRFRLNARAST